MLYELPPQNHAALTSFFQPMNHHLILQSVIAGLTPATVYVDNPEKTTAALCHYKDRFYLSGRPDSTDFNRALKELFNVTIFPEAQSQDREAFVVYPDSDAWSPTIEAILEGHKSLQAPRSYLRLTTHPTASTPLPDHIAIHPIDESLLAQIHLNHLDELVEEIQSERDTVEDFLNKSFGVCAIAGNDIAGLCTSEFNTAHRCEVGIMTMEGYQRQGIATALGNALATRASASGITEIGWHCWTRNTPSVATALKLGFQPALDYTATVGWYTPNP